MANYGLIYKSTFDPIGAVSANPVFEIDILQKEYTGDVSSILCAGVPVVHTYQTDDPKAAIKGSSLKLSFINKGSLPLTSFLSNDDQFFKVRLYKSGSLLFEGFIVQDDCSEILVDYNHEIIISANDGLGLLKGINIDKSPAYFLPVYNDPGDTYSTIAGNTVVVSATLAPNVLVGDILKIHTQIFDTTYTVVDNTGVTTLIVKETVVTSPSPITADITVTRSSLLDKVTLASIIGNCLLNTGLTLNIKVWGRIHEVTQDLTSCFLLQTLIDPQTFVTGTTTTGMPGSVNINLTDYQSCYTILTNLLGRFKFTLFQANGVWNLVRWDDLRYYANIIPSYNFDSNFTYLGTENLPAAISVAANLPPAAVPGYYPTYGLLHRVSRGLEFNKETFNYKQPALLLRNGDLTLLGNLLKKYNVDVWFWGGNTYYKYDDAVDAAPSGAVITKSFQTWLEYTALWWSSDVLLGSSTTATYYIRVIEDSFGHEVERYIVLVMLPGEPIDSYKIEGNAGDVFIFSFNERSTFSAPGGNSDLYVILTDGVTKKYLVNGLGWTTLPNLYAIPDLIAPDNTNGWHSYSVDSSLYPLPNDGHLYFVLYPIRNSVNTLVAGETQIKDLKIDYSFNINGSTNIIGQYSQTTQTNAIKQNDSLEIFVDSSPRNSISGTLFLNAMAVNIQKRAGQWRHTYFNESEILGQLTTGDEMLWRKKTRTILEGTVYGTSGVSMLSVFKYDQLQNLNFVFGYVDIDYKNNNFTGTLWEMYYDGEAACVKYSFGINTFPPGAWSISGTDCNGNAFNYSSISGTGAIPPPICAQKGSIVCTGDVVATEQGSCGDFISNYKFQYLYNPI